MSTLASKRLTSETRRKQRARHRGYNQPSEIGDDTPKEANTRHAEEEQYADLLIALCRTAPSTTQQGLDSFVVKAGSSGTQIRASVNFSRISCPT